MKKLLVLLSLCITVVFAGKPMLTDETKGMLKDAKQEVTGLEAKEVNSLIKEGKVIMIDVRNPNEWAKGTIKSDKLVTVSRGFLEVKYPKAILSKYNKNDEFVVYCGIEPRAILASQTLKELGFTNVKYLKGGYNNWKKTGLPVTSK